MATVTTKQSTTQVLYVRGVKSTNLSRVQKLMDRQGIKTKAEFINKLIEGAYKASNKLEASPTKKVTTSKKTLKRTKKVPTIKRG